MEKQIVYARWIEIETTHGTQWIPQYFVGLQSVLSAEAVADYIEGKFIRAQLVDGYGARLSMPGYLDCTEWTVYDTEEAARAGLELMYGND